MKHRALLLALLALVLTEACSKNFSATFRAPDGPRQLVAVPEVDRVLLDWDLVPAATSYDIYYASAHGVDQGNTLHLSDFTAILNVQPPHTIVLPDSTKNWYFVITASNATGQGKESPEVPIRVIGGRSLGVPPDTTPSFVLLGVGTNGAIGSPGRLSSAGDVNGDGLDDILAGVAFGNPPDATGGQILLDLAVASSGLLAPIPEVRSSPMGGAEMGNSVSRVGDIDGDGFDDVVVGVPFYANGQSEEGAIFVYLGSATGLSQNPTVIEGNVDNALFGFTVAGAGDVNGDGFADVVVAAPISSKIFLFLGGPSGLVTPAAETIPAPSAQIGFFGYSMSAGCDVQHDGHPDLVVGAPLSNETVTDGGAAILFIGNGAGYDTSFAWQVNGSVAEELTGRSVACLHNISGNGVGGILVGSPGDGGGSGSIASYPGFQGTIPLTTPAAVYPGSAGSGLGESVADVGDLNGDGFTDFAAGAPRDATFGAEAGTVLLWYGPDAASSQTPPVLQFYGQIVQGHRGFGVAGAGDIDGDGSDELLIGEPGFATDDGRVLVMKGPPSQGPVVTAGTIDAHAGINVFPAGASFSQIGAGHRYQCAWDWGDGTPSLIIPSCTPATVVGTSVKHKYAAATTSATHTVLLEVTDEFGTTGTAALRVIVAP